MPEETATVTKVVKTTAVPEFASEAPKPPSTALKSLKLRRDSLKKDLYLDLQVPRWDDPEIFVRFGPIDSTLTEQQIEKRRKSKVKEFNVLANADILASACIGVYACVDGDYENKYSLRENDPESNWTRFDADLGKNLGVLDASNAVSVVRALYLTDGDLLQAAADLVEWSGRSSAKLESDFSTP